MEYSTLMHAHKGIIYLFLFFFSFKVTLMFVSPSFFKKFRDKTKMVEMILGTLIVITGVWLLSQRGWSTEPWLLTKILLVAVAMAVAIVGLRKGSKVLAVISLVIFIYIFLVAINKSLTLSENCIKTNTEVVYYNLDTTPVMLSQTECASFHGKLNTFASIQ